MKYIFKLLFLLCLAAAANAQPLKPYEQTRTPQVLSNWALWSKYFQSIPHGTTPGFPSYVPDSAKCGALYFVPGTGLKIYDCNTLTWIYAGADVNKAYVDAGLAAKQTLMNQTTNTTDNPAFVSLLFPYTSTLPATPPAALARIYFDINGSETILKANGNTRAFKFPYSGNEQVYFPLAPVAHLADRDSVNAQVALISAARSSGDNNLSGRINTDSLRGVTNANNIIALTAARSTGDNNLSGRINTDSLRGVANATNIANEITRAISQENLKATKAHSDSVYARSIYLQFPGAPYTPFLTSGYASQDGAGNFILNVGLGSVGKYYVWAGDSVNVTVPKFQQISLSWLKDGAPIQNRINLTASGLTSEITRAIAQENLKLNLTGGTLSGDIQQSGTPVNSFSLVNKNYVDGAGYSTAWKQPVIAASTANVSLTAPGTTLDGVTLVSGNRILLKNQTDATQNGIYIFNGSASTLTRSLDANTGTLIYNATVLVGSAGATNGDMGYSVSNATQPTLGTDAITLVQTSGNNLYSNGTGISQTGKVFSLNLTYTDARYAPAGNYVNTFNGRFGTVMPGTGDYNTSQVTEGTNQYFTNARAIAATLTGFASGAGTVTSSDNILQSLQKINGNQVNDAANFGNYTTTTNADNRYILASPGTAQPKNINITGTVTAGSATLSGNLTPGGIALSPSASLGNMVSIWGNENSSIGVKGFTAAQTKAFLNYYTSGDNVNFGSFNATGATTLTTLSGTTAAFSGLSRLSSTTIFSGLTSGNTTQLQIGTTESTAPQWLNISNNGATGMVLQAVNQSISTNSLFLNAGGGQVNVNSFSNLGYQLGVNGTIGSSISITAPTFIGSLTGHASLDLPLTGGTLTGALYGTLAQFSSTGSFGGRVTASDPTSAAYVSPGVFVAPNITPGQVATLYVGKSLASYNSVAFAYTHSADGSTSNRMDFLFNGVSTPIWSALGTGFFGIGGYIADPTSGNKLGVNGNSYFNGIATITGNATVGGTFDVTGATSLAAVTATSFIKASPTNGSTAILLANGTDIAQSSFIQNQNATQIASNFRLNGTAAATVMSVQNTSGGHVDFTIDPALTSTGYGVNLRSLPGTMALTSDLPYQSFLTITSGTTAIPNTKQIIYVDASGGNVIAQITPSNMATSLNQSQVIVLKGLILLRTRQQ